MRQPTRALALLLAAAAVAHGHGTVVSPKSRVYRVYRSNPENPNFQLAANAVAIDGKDSYYTWNELSRNIPDAVQAGLPPGFDYSPWVPDGELASGGRTDPNSNEYPRTYAGLDQVSGDWPSESVRSGEVITVDFLATAVHEPSVWDVWMTTPDWTPDQPLTWGKLEFLGRPSPALTSGHYTFDLEIPCDRQGHHVLWIAWQRDDPAGEVFFSTSDLMIEAPGEVFCDQDPSNAATIAVDSCDCAAPSIHVSMNGASANEFGYLLVGAGSGALVDPPGASGSLCLGGSPIGRYTLDADLTDGTGFLQTDVLNALTGGGGGNLPDPLGGNLCAPPGQTWNFQYWYRDGAQPSRFSRAISVTFR